MAIRIGFIGFGEVGSTFLAAMRAGGADTAAFDIIESKVKEAGAAYKAIGDLVGGSELILSTVTTQAARSAAESCLPYLKRGQFYVDLNSTSASIKLELDRIIRPTRAQFVEGAILGAVGVTGAATRILIGGPAGRDIAESLRAAGLNTTFFSEELGKASTFKMLRSIFSKGVEALVLELLIAGRRAGIETELWTDVTEFMDRNAFGQVAENWIQTHATACERRYHEMVQVAETLREIGIAPVMAAATESFFNRSRLLELYRAFPTKPRSKEEVITYMEGRLRSTER